MLSSKNGISRHLSPVAIILMSPNKDYNKLKVTFGSYSQVYIVTTNSTKQKIEGVMALRRAHEPWRIFFGLATVKQIHPPLIDRNIHQSSSNTEGELPAY